MSEPTDSLYTNAVAKEGNGAVREDAVMDEIVGQDAERLLLCAQEAGGTAAGDVLAGLVGGDVRYARELVAQLVGHGLAYPSSYDGELSLTGQGRRIGARIAASLANGWRRDDLTRRWVLERARTGERFATSDLVEEWEAKRGRSADEIERAIEVLAERRLIEVLKTAGETIVMGIDQRGRDALERSVVVRPASVPSMVVNNNHSDHSRTLNQLGGTIGGVQFGDHSTQHNAVTLDADPGEVRAVLLRALDHVEDLPSQIADSVRDALNEAITETKMPDPRVGFIRELAQKVILAVGVAAGSNAGREIFTLIGPLVG